MLLTRKSKSKRYAIVTMLATQQNAKTLDRGVRPAGGNHHIVFGGETVSELRSSVIGPFAGLVAIVTIAASAVLGPGEVRFLRVVGAAVGLVALFFAFVPILLLHRLGRPIEGMGYMHTRTVVDSGLFSVVRHPQYLGYILFMLTFSLFAQRPLVTALAGLSIGLLYVNTLLEERECTRKLGQEYRSYLERVPRFNLAAGLWRRLRRRD